MSGEITASATSFQLLDEFEIPQIEPLKG